MTLSYLTSFTVTFFFSLILPCLPFAFAQVFSWFLKVYPSFFPSFLMHLLIIYLNYLVFFLLYFLVLCFFQFPCIVPSIIPIFMYPSSCMSLSFFCSLFLVSFIFSLLSYTFLHQISFNFPCCPLLSIFASLLLSILFFCHFVFHVSFHVSFLPYFLNFLHTLCSNHDITVHSILLYIVTLLPVSLHVQHLQCTLCYTLCVKYWIFCHALL